MRLGISLAINKLYNVGGQVVLVWILATGLWNNSGRWVDTEFWKDS